MKPIDAPLPMPADGLVRYENLFSIQPFYNNLVTMTLSGAQVLTLLEQQWKGQDERGRVLQVSRGTSFAWDAKRPLGERVVPGSVKINGQPLTEPQPYGLLREVLNDLVFTYAERCDTPTVPAAVKRAFRAVERELGERYGVERWPLSQYLRWRSARRRRLALVARGLTPKGDRA